MSQAPSVTLSSLRLRPFLETPRFPLRLGRWLLAALALSLFGFVFAPWQQSVEGTGRVVAYSPTDREQDLHAPVSGRIEKWHVVEGSPVRAGDPIAEMADIDPQYLARLKERIQADEKRIQAAEQRLTVYEEQVESYEKARTTKVQAMRLKVEMATQKRNVAEQKANLARAALEIARSNLDRTEQLTEKGINSRRQLELAQLDFAKAEAEFNLTRAELTEAEANRAAATAEVAHAEAEAGAKVATALAEVEKASAEAAYARGDVAKLLVERSRQLAQSIKSPVDGTVISIDGNLGGGVVMAGQHLAKIVPNTKSRAVEVFVDGNDAPLIEKGRKVRLQFEGWPAVQFVGWPSVAVGSFGGTVSFVDPAATDQKGRVRVLIVPDGDSPPWPDYRRLRQQVRVRAWFLLDTVSVGWELWRRINGFPPSFYVAPEDPPNATPKAASAKGEKK